MIVTLCGFMGAGKSTLGKSLARFCGYKFVDLDNYIEDKHAMSVSNLFSKIGEQGFRNEETEALQEIIDEYNYLNTKSSYGLILALGGGTVTHKPSAELVDKFTHCIYLRCSKDALLQRLMKNNSKRPLLAGKSKEELSSSIDSLMSKRESIYISCAKTIFNTDNSNIQTLVESLAEKIKKSSV